MTKYDIKSGFNFPGVFIAFDDIHVLFRYIVSHFSNNRNPDKGIIQSKLLLTNSISEDGIWSSKNDVELLIRRRKGLGILYHYNSEALNNKKCFQNYKLKVEIKEIPNNKNSTVFFLSKNSSLNHGNHLINDKDAIGFIIFFHPKIEKNEIIKYSYNQSYKALKPLWGNKKRTENKDFRFIRETYNFERVIKFPKKYYDNVSPRYYILSSDRKKRIDFNEIMFSQVIDEEIVAWKFSISKPPKESIFRIEWETPEI